MADSAKIKNYSDNFGIKEIEVSYLSTLEDRPILIDVRRPEEWTGELGYISGSKLVEMGPALEKYIEELSKDEDYVIICRSGMRSANVTAFMTENGFPRVFNLKGGMIAWKEQGLPSESNLLA